MNCYLYKLSFLTPLHCGAGESAKSLDSSSASICADTLFSALCSQAAVDGGPEAASELCAAAKEGEALFSDLFPYHGEELYIPKPAMLPAAFSETLAADKKKVMKSLEYIPILKLDDYASSMRGKAAFEIDGIFKDFASAESIEKVSLKGREESSPYCVAATVFNAKCGLYGIVLSKNQEILTKIKRLLRLLGAGGIGGKVSSGYGKFKILGDEIEMENVNEAVDAQTTALWRMLSAENVPSYLSLTTSLPADGELEEALTGALTTVRRRGGFVTSEEYGAARKKDTQYFLGAGSLFRRKYKGSLYNVASGGVHPVYRYSKPIFLGVDYQ